MRFGIFVFATLFVTLLNAQTKSARDYHIARAILTSGIENREPIDQLSDHIVGISGEIVKFYFFTQITNKKDTAIQHRWIYNDEVVAEITLNIGSDNWRTYSSKRIRPSWSGEWQVQVIDEQQHILAQHNFTYSVTE